MAKTPKDPKKKGNPNKDAKSDQGNSSTIFTTLFGEIPEQNSAFNSLFSENNPFRRKLLETRDQNNELGLGFPAKDAQNDGNLGDSDLSELKKQKKRRNDEEKDESSGLDPKSVSEKTKKLKRVERKGNEGDDKSNLDIKSKEAPENKIEHSPENEKKKKKKRKRDEVEAEYEAKRYGVTDEVKENKEESSVLGEKRKKMDNPEDMVVSKEGFDDESKLLRTVFVGNLPLKLKKKEIMKEFGKFGEVESVRIRSVPIVDGKIPRKGAVIKKKFNDNVDSVNAYVVFETEESAQASLAHNMAVVGGNHIRVDRACPPRKKLKGDSSTLYDNKRTVFVGNLPFDVKDEEVYKLFCGIKNLETSIEAVRVIRDSGSSLGKGIAYVLFKTTDAANLILKKRLRLRDRELRLSHAKSTSETPSKRRSSQPETNTSSSKKSRTFDNENAKANLSYQGLRASKSGAQKKVNTRINFSGKSKSQPAAAEPRSGKGKRPSVAARKEKALRAAAKGTTQVTGAKRKFGNRTPDEKSGGLKKKARKLFR